MGSLHHPPWNPELSQEQPCHLHVPACTADGGGSPDLQPLTLLTVIQQVFVVQTVSWLSSPWKPALPRPGAPTEDQMTQGASPMSPANTWLQERNQRLERVAILKTVTQKTKIIKILLMKRNQKNSSFLSQNENVFRASRRISLVLLHLRGKNGMPEGVFSSQLARCLVCLITGFISVRWLHFCALASCLSDFSQFFNVYCLEPILGESVSHGQDQ